MVVGRLAGEHQQLLRAVPARAVEDPLDLVGLVQVRLVRGERAVLAVAAARPGERERQVSREGDAAGHRSPRYRCAHRSHLALLGLLIGGCGGVAGDDRPDEDATLLLDFPPDAVHAGIYLATERGYDEAEGVELEVRRPGASADARGGCTPAARTWRSSSIHDLALARERGDDMVGVYAVVQPPRLVLCVKRTTLEDRRPLVRAAIRALQRGYAQAQAEPDSAVAAVLARDARARPRPSSRRSSTPSRPPSRRASARPASCARTCCAGRVGPALGILSKPLDVDKAFDFDQVGPVRNPS